MDEASEGYDVFFSLGGCDRAEAEKIVRALRRRNLKVFLDRDRIRVFDGITEAIRRALRTSKVLVAYYSEAYPQRSACQFELTAAFLAAAQEGDPSRRILVINPEDPLTGHLQPATLRDAKYALPPAPGDVDAMARLVSRIVERVRSVSGTFADIEFDEQPRWFGDRMPGVVDFVGRYKEQWELHSVLESGSLSLTHDAAHGPVAVLAGIPGVGKTALVAAYAWQFGAAHGGGVYWISLAGATAANALERYVAEVRTLAETLCLPSADLSPGRLFGVVAKHLCSGSGPSLWVVDDVPTDLDPMVLHRLLIPAGGQVRTVLVADADAFSGVVETVRVHGMEDYDARLLLTGFRPIERDDLSEITEAVALDHVVERLGGHALALRLTGLRLRDRQGLVSYADFASRLESDATALDVVADHVSDAVRRLDDIEALILWIAVVGMPAALPVSFIRHLVLTLAVVPEGDVAGPDRSSMIGSALDLLRGRLLATATDTLWRIAPVALDAVRRHLTPRVPLADIARAAADAIRTDADRSPAERLHLMRFADTLVGPRWVEDLSDEVTVDLLRLLAGYHNTGGNRSGKRSTATVSSIAIRMTWTIGWQRRWPMTPLGTTRYRLIWRPLLRRRLNASATSTCPIVLTGCSRRLLTHWAGSARRRRTGMRSSVPRFRLRCPVRSDSVLTWRMSAASFAEDSYATLSVASVICWRRRVTRRLTTCRLPGSNWPASSGRLTSSAPPATPHNRCSTSIVIYQIMPPRWQPWRSRYRPGSPWTSPSCGRIETSGRRPSTQRKDSLTPTVARTAQRTV